MDKRRLAEISGFAGADSETHRLLSKWPIAIALMMEAISTPEMSVNSTRLHGATSQSLSSSETNLFNVTSCKFSSIWLPIS
jgi:hypothetical protein